ncbi:hypothetical protein CGL27_10830 [Streptomyces sp. 11-1-2]|nr:hypothetical protein CGL27_10830 [Streptomyces sp. 11-1-2]
MVRRGHVCSRRPIGSRRQALRAPARLTRACEMVTHDLTPGRWEEQGRSTVETAALIATLSLWTDLPSAFDSICTGLHRAALNRRYDWFERAGHPGYVFWWVTDDTIPTWQDGVTRLEHLHDHGYAPYAFTFHHSFDPAGTVVVKSNETFVAL